MSPPLFEAYELRPDMVEVRARVGNAEASDRAKEAAEQAYVHSTTSSA